MKKLILASLCVLLLSGCGQKFHDFARQQNMMVITPDPCGFDYDKKRFFCGDIIQEKYLEDHELTKEDLDVLGQAMPDNIKTAIIISKIYDCSLKAQDSSLVCTYRFSKNLMDRYKNRGEEVEERRQGDTYVYYFPHMFE